MPFGFLVDSRKSREEADAEDEATNVISDEEEKTKKKKKERIERKRKPIASDYKR